MQSETLWTNQSDFAARIARIESGEGSSKRTLFVGVDESFVLDLPKPKARRAGSGRRGGVLFAVVLLGMLTSGGAVLVQKDPDLIGRMLPRSVSLGAINLQF